VIPVKSHKKPHFPRPPGDSSCRPTPSSIIHHPLVLILYPKQRRRKKCPNYSIITTTVSTRPTSTLLVPMTGLILAWLSPQDPRLRHQDIRTAESEMWGNGSYKPRGLEAGTLVVWMGNPITRPCLSMEVLVSAKHTEVQLLSIVCSTGGRGSKPRLWNIQNLGAVPPYIR